MRRDISWVEGSAPPEMATENKIFAESGHGGDIDISVVMDPSERNGMYVDYNQTTRKT